MRVFGEHYVKMSFESNSVEEFGPKPTKNTTNTTRKAHSHLQVHHGVVLVPALAALLESHVLQHAHALVHAHALPGTAGLLVEVQDRGDRLRVHGVGQHGAPDLCDVPDLRLDQGFPLGGLFVRLERHDQPESKQKIDVVKFVRSALSFKHNHQFAYLLLSGLRRVLNATAPPPAAAVMPTTAK